MFSKVFLAAAILAVASARPQHEHRHAISSQNIVLHQSHGHVQSSHDAHSSYQHDDHNSHPKYEFSYQVSDGHTGDHKSQHESRDGDHVQGAYSLHEADGSVRIVEYSADKHSGFHANVRHEGHAKHVIPEQKQYQYHH